METKEAYRYIYIYILQSDNLSCVQRTPVQFSPGCQEGRKEVASERDRKKEGGGDETFKNKKRGEKREQEKFFNNVLSK